MQLHALIKQKSGHFDLGCVTRLNLAKLQLQHLSGLDACPELIELSLADNQVGACYIRSKTPLISPLDQISQRISVVGETSSIEFILKSDQKH